MSDTERRYGIAGRAAAEAARVIGRGQPLRGGTDALLLSRIARAVVDALDADDRGAVAGAVRALEYLADPESWAGDPRKHATALYGHDTPFELAQRTLTEMRGQ